MKYNKEKWIAAYQKTVKDLNTTAATQGRICSSATVRVIRDGVIEEVISAYKKGDTTEDVRLMLKDAFNELLAEVSKETNDGFASNASAAAKAAGFKSTSETVVGLND